MSTDRPIPERWRAVYEFGTYLEDPSELIEEMGVAEAEVTKLRTELEAERKNTPDGDTEKIEASRHLEVEELKRGRATAESLVRDLARALEAAKTALYPIGRWNAWQDAALSRVPKELLKP